MDQDTSHLLAIGRFAKASHLSLKALRLYDQRKILEPAYIDPDSGYRYYHIEQLNTARLIRNMRQMEIPLAMIQEVLSTDSGEVAAKIVNDYVDSMKQRMEVINSASRRLISHLTHQEEVTMTFEEGVPLFARGKVRDVYDLDDRLLIVATDRISAHDVVVPNGIPGKGKILTEMSLFWFDRLAGLVRDHLITDNVDEYPEEVQPYKDQLEGRSMLVVKAERIDVECVARGYLAGSGWREYQQSGMVCGIPLPAGLQESSRLSEPIFTPATKAETGHDENISFDQMCEIVDPELAGRLRDLTLKVYAAARDYAEGRGIIIADTKFEFGLHDGGIVLIDEILSPDSSRFWDQEVYGPGRSQDSFDKQFVRDYLDTLDWDKTPPAPALPEEIVRKTLEKYREARDRLLG